MPRFTFRKYREVHWSDGYSSKTSSEIRLNGEIVGYILFSSDAEKFKITFRGPASKRQLEFCPNCPWGWKKVLQEFDSDKDARQWISKNNKQFYATLYREGAE